MNRDTPVVKVYEAIRKIKGREQKKINILKENGRYYSTVEEISNRMVQTFSNISSTDNYDPSFQQIKLTQEQSPINFNSLNNEIYNEHFTMQEFNAAVDLAKETTPGQDKINYQMLKCLQSKARNYILVIYNRLWEEHHFPTQWRQAIVIPIPKPGKPHDKSANYRPIALTSCLCKTLERIINARLVEYFDMHKIIGKVQCGGKKHRSTLDHLVRLETAIRTAFAKKEHFVSVFYDLEKAYDRTWRYGILLDLHRAGLRGRLPKFIEEFLQDRRIRVRIGDCMSEEKRVENGVPQGSVLSVTLFALKINHIVKLIPSDANFHVSLYVDDVQIGYHHTDLGVIQEKMQQCLDKVHRWANRNGFTFSPSKSKAMHFCTHQSIYSNPQLKLNDGLIEYCDSIKFLGLYLDPKLRWDVHIGQLKTKCTKILSLLRSVTAQEWGADQHTILSMYRSLLRSRLEYGYIVYGSASRQVQRPLYAVTTEAIRIATGAFRSSPIDSLFILTNEMPPQIRKEYLTLKYFYKIRSQINNPACQPAVVANNQLLFRNKNMTPPFAIRAIQLIEELGLRRTGVKPEFCHQIHSISTPTWAIPKPEVNLELSNYPKQYTDPIIFKQLFQQIEQEMTAEGITIYTDGSKGEMGVGAAAVTEVMSVTASMLKESSIFSAEVYAIHLALSIVKQTEERQFTICSDSLSAIRGLVNGTDHPMLRKILHDINDLHKRDKRVKFCWVPSHINIPGNEKADAAAKEAARRPEEFIPIYYRDWNPIIEQKIRERWAAQWGSSSSKLLGIASRPGELPVIKYTNRREEVVLNRLRVGHSLITHGYLMDDDVPDVPPVCNVCNEAQLTIRHILLTCPGLERERREHMTDFRSGQRPSLRNLLGSAIKPKDILQYLRSIEVYKQI